MLSRRPLPFRSSDRYQEAPGRVSEVEAADVPLRSRPRAAGIPARRSRRVRHRGCGTRVFLFKFPAADTL